MKGNRIVITGLGVLSPMGIGKDVHWQGLKEGRLGIRAISVFDTTPFEVKMGGEVPDFNPKEILGKIGLVDLDRASTLLSSAMKFALEDSRLTIDECNTRRTGISVGTTFGSLNSLSEFDKICLLDGPRFVNASRFPNTVINSPASRAAIRFGIKGFNTTVSSGFCAGIDAIDYAVHALNFNRAQRVLAGAVEEISFQTFLGFSQLGYLSESSKFSSSVSRPFDRNRDGIILSEGATVVLLETLESAHKRNAQIYAEIISIASGFQPSAFHDFKKRAEGVANTMKLVLEKAGLKKESIDCIFANANSTIDGDLVESKAINMVFGKSQPPVTAIKSMIGETFSLSGAMNLVSAVCSMGEGFIPAIQNYQTKDNDCDLNLVLKVIKGLNLQYVMVNCFDPSGANTAMVVKKTQESYNDRF